MIAQTSHVNVQEPQHAEGLERLAWKWMRYTGLLLIPLAWGHVKVQDILVGVHAIDLDYIRLSWDGEFMNFLLLIFAFAQGVNWLRQVQ
jgi:succinate dehydrogenase / fumarate reductase membrane anchor subunit